MTEGATATDMRLPTGRLELDDMSLVDLVAAGDSTALAEIVRRHGAVLVAVAARVLGPAGGQDVVQDVLTTLWRRPERFDRQRGPLRAFLILQVRSRCVDILRSDSARRSREDADRADPVARLRTSEADALYSHETLRDLLERLDANEREPIRLAFFDGYTYREVALLLQLPEGTVKSRIRSGLRRLRAGLDADADVEVHPQL